VNELPLVSVVIPTYNRAHLIERAVQSVLHQTYPHFELIVVDDGSTDNTADVLARISDPRLHYIRLPHNIGGGGARNVGLQQSHGKYVSFLDSDDEFLPTKLEQQVMFIERESKTDRRVGAVYCRFYKQNDVTNQRSISSKLVYEDTAVYPQVLRGWTQELPTFLIRRELVIAVGMFDTRLRRFQDPDLWQRLSQVCFFRSMPEPLVIVHTHSMDQVTRNFSVLEESVKLLTEKWQSAIEREVGKQGTHTLARTLLRWGYMNTVEALTEQRNRYAALAILITCIRKTGWIPARPLFWAFLPIVVGMPATEQAHHLVAAYKRWWASSVAAAR